MAPDEVPYLPFRRICDAAHAPPLPDSRSPTRTIYLRPAPQPRVLAAGPRPATRPRDATRSVTGIRHEMKFRWADALQNLSCSREDGVDPVCRRLDGL